MLSSRLANILLLLCSIALIASTISAQLFSNKISSSLFYSSQDVTPTRYFEEHPYSFFYKSPTNNISIPLSKLNGKILDSFTDYCGTIYIAGEFTQIFYNITNNTKSYFSLIHHGFDYSTLNLGIPLFILNPQLMKGLYEINSLSAASPLFSSIQNYEFSSINTVYADCHDIKPQTLSYCNAQCDVFIGGNFAFDAVQTNGNTIRIVNSAKWNAKTGVWESLLSPSFADSNQAVTYITRTSLGSFIGFANGNFYVATDHMWSHLKFVTKFSKSDIKHVLPWNGQSKSVAIIAGNIKSATCQYFCILSMDNMTLQAPPKTISLSSAVLGTAIDFQASLDTLVYFADEYTVKQWDPSSDAWNNAVIDTSQISNSPIASIGMCYENSNMCSRESEYLYITLMNGMVIKYNAQFVQTSLVTLNVLSNQQVVKLTAEDGLIPSQLFNVPNSGQISSGMQVQVYADVSFPRAQYNCVFDGSVAPAQLSQDATSIQCTVPHNVSLTYPRNSMFLQTVQRMPASSRSVMKNLNYSRVLLYYDGQDLCEAGRFDLRYKMSKFMGVAILVITVCFIVSTVALLLLSFIFLVPCKCNPVSQWFESLVLKLENEQIEITEDKQVQVKQKSVLGGWVTFLLIYLFSLAAAYMVIGAVDPFQVTSTEDIDTFGKTPMAFRMAWTIVRTNCNFNANCTEYVKVTEPLSMTVTNLTSQLYGNSSMGPLTYQLDIATEIYSDQRKYSIAMDQCCNTYEVRPIPMMRVSDSVSQGLNFQPAFSVFNDYQKVAELKISDIRYMFNTYSNAKNKTSSVVFNNRWNNLKLQSQDDFISLIQDAFINKRQPKCLVNQCDLTKTSSQGTRYNLIIPDTCFELGSGDDATVMQFKLWRQSSEILYSGIPSMVGIIIKVVTLVGSVLGLRPALTGLITSVHDKINLYFSQFKTLIILILALMLYVPSLGIAVSTWASETNLVEFLLHMYNIDSAFTRSPYYIALVNTIGALSDVIVTLVLNSCLAWNADFFSEFRDIRLFTAAFWKKALSEPFRRIGFGWKKSIAFRIIFILWMLNFIPVFPFVGFLVIATLWKIFITSWFEQEYMLSEAEMIINIDNEGEDAHLLANGYHEL